MATRLQDDSNDTHISGSHDIILDATGGDVYFAAGGTKLLQINNDSSDVTLQPVVSGKKLQLSTQAGNVAANVDSAQDSFGLFRKIVLGAESITSDDDLDATKPVSVVIAGAGNVTGTLADAAATGFVKIVIGLTTSSGAPKLTFKDATGGSVTKTLTVGTGVILYSIDVGGGSVRWMKLGDTS